MDNSVFQDQDDQYIYKVAKNVQDEVHLVEPGFDYVTGEYGDGGKPFEKKKLLYFSPASGFAGL
jgi:hypothetical protein